MRVICGYCSNLDKSICKECNWIDSKYPLFYAGKKFPNGALKLLEKPIKNGEN